MKRLALVIVLLAAACTGGSDSGEQSQETVTSTTTTSAPTDATETTAAAEVPLAPVEHGPAADDRIVMLTGGGDLVVVAPDGSGAKTLASASDAAISQPVWAPDGTRIAWTEATPGAFGGSDFSLVTANTDGSDPTTITTPFPSFYSSWDPTSSVLAILGSSAGGGVGLAIADADRSGAAVQVDQSSPYYFVWDPFGTTMLAHAGNSLRLVTPNGDVSPFTIGDGLYQVPGVVGEGNQIVFAEGSDELGVLALGNIQTGELSVLAGYQGMAWLGVDPTGSQVAILSVHQPTPDDAEETPPVDDESLDFDVLAEGLDVIDIATGDATRVTADPTLAYFWSPDGSRMLILELTGVDDQIWFQWSVWDGSSRVPVGELFQPSPDFGSGVLPFFDQYSVSHDLWAPDNQRITYTGTSIDGRNGAWVLDTLSNEISLIAEGATIAFWSPT